MRLLTRTPVVRPVVRPVLNPVVNLVIKEFENYHVRTRHTNADLADAVNVEDVRQSTVVLAVFAWHAAMRDERIP